MFCLFRLQALIDGSVMVPPVGVPQVDVLLPLDDVPQLARIANDVEAALHVMEAAVLHASCFFCSFEKSNALSQ